MTAESEWQDQCVQCVGRTSSASDELSPVLANGLLATLNDDSILENGHALPHLFHWLFFNKVVKTNALKSDGHEKLGAFLPPIRNPRRMWAGSAIEFHQPLILGRAATKRSEIKSIEFKAGSKGSLCFVKVEHQYGQDQATCITDTQTIVFIRHPSRLNATDLSPKGPGDCSIDPIMLFRYSALTLNSHRTHFDREYACREEGYAGLVVHGPLIASLLLRHAIADRPSEQLESFYFQGIAPLIDGEGFRIESNPTDDDTSFVLTKTNGVQTARGTVRWMA